MLIHQQVRRMRHPFRQRDVLVFAGLEHLEKDQVGVASILDVMRIGNRDVSDIALFKVHRSGSGAGSENRHAALASNVVLPLVCVRMPVQFTEAAGSQTDDRSGNWSHWKDL